jgi:hypothetical protein
VSIAIAALGAAVTLIPLLRRYLPARVATAAAGEHRD